MVSWDKAKNNGSRLSTRAYQTFAIGATISPMMIRAVKFGSIAKALLLPLTNNSDLGYMLYQLVEHVKTWCQY